VSVLTHHRTATTTVPPPHHHRSATTAPPPLRHHRTATAPQPPHRHRSGSVPRRSAPNGTPTGHAMRENGRRSVVV